MTVECKCSQTRSAGVFSASEGLYLCIMVNFEIVAPSTCESIVTGVWAMFYT